MKKKIVRGSILILALIMVVCSLSACKKHEEAKVGEAVVAFVGDYYFDNDFDKAISMCEKEAYEAITKEVEDLKMCFTEEDLLSMAESSSFETFNVKTEELTLKGNTANVKLVIKLPNEEITKWKYKLEKIDDNWKIVSFEGDYNKPNEDKVTEIVSTFTNNYYSYYRFGKVTPEDEARISNPRYAWSDKLKVILNPLCKGDVSDTLLKEAGAIKEQFTEEEIMNFAENASPETIKIQTNKTVVRWDKAVVRLTAQMTDGEIVNWEYKLEKIEGVWKIASVSSDYKKPVIEVVNTFIDDCYINYDFDKARLVCADEAYDIIKNEVDNLKASYAEEEIHKMAEDKQFESVVLVENKAVVKSTLPLPNEEFVNWEYKLEKTEGEWKITSIKKIDAQ